jgi:hypothetical protein
MVVAKPAPLPTLDELLDDLGFSESPIDLEPMQTLYDQNKNAVCTSDEDIDDLFRSIDALGPAAIHQWVTHGNYDRLDDTAITDSPSATPSSDEDDGTPLLPVTNTLPRYTPPVSPSDSIQATPRHSSRVRNTLIRSHHAPYTYEQMVAMDVDTLADFHFDVLKDSYTAYDFTQEQRKEISSRRRKCRNRRSASVSAKKQRDKLLAQQQRIQQLEECIHSAGSSDGGCIL